VRPGAGRLLHDHRPSSPRSADILLDHLLGGVRVNLTSRTDPPLPLARWRVRGRLAEIRAQDLLFTLDEATEFLTRLTGRALTTQAVTTLERRTEGWIAGLQLAALSLMSVA
jgi:LuxR family maltose regulon positive regulatory protein